MKTKDDNSKGGDSSSDASWPERNVNVVIAGLVIACIGSLIAQLWWAPLFSEKHVEGSHVEASHDDGAHDETSHDEHTHGESSHDGASHLHPAEFAVEEVFGFEAMFGFAAFVAVVFLGTGLRLVIMRDEDYYDS